MIKIIAILIVFLLLICGTVTASDYTIVDDTVFFDDSNVYLSASPHTLASSGWVYFNLTSKIYSGNIDVVWGFNTSVTKPQKAELYNPHWINTTTDHTKTFYNPTFRVYEGGTFDYGNSYNTNYKYTIIEEINNANGTTYITSNASFDSFDTDGTNYTIYWYTRYDNHYMWKDFSSSFNSVIYDYNGYDKWYYIKDIPVNSSVNYTVRGWMDIPVSLEKQNGKYYFAIKPSSETISEAVNNGHFYNLDPWWNATWVAKKTIILTGNTSGAQTDYQILLNITWETGMQSDFDDLRFTNETHKLDAWLESKVDNSYALVWVEFPTTPVNGMTQNYWMYYGNTGAASDWNGVATFLFFDDFESGSLDTLKWDDNQYTPTVQTNVVKSGTYSVELSGTAYTILGTSAISSLTPPLMFEVDIKNSGQARCLRVETSTVYSIGWDGSNANWQTYVGWWQSLGIAHSTDWTKLGLITPISGNVQYYIDGVLGSPEKTMTGSLTRMKCYIIATSPLYADNYRVYKYVVNPPTYEFGVNFYIPPDPIDLDHATGNFWINHTWAAGSGNVIDSYNVSVNDVWYNETPTFYNDTYTPHAWQNITVYAFNSSGTGTLSTGYVSRDTQILNNPVTITNTSDWTGDAGDVVYVDYDGIDADSDTLTFSCNRTDLFTDFDASTGKGNWTATANIYYVDFGVSDGHGSVSNYTMTLTELSVEPPSLLDELKLIMSEIINEFKSVSMGNYLVYAFILIGILLIIFIIQILNNNIRG